MKYLLIAAGGAIGSLLRYAMSGFTYRYAAGVFPWGTLAVNLTGCFMIGLLGGIAERFIISPNFKPFVFVGLLGGFTTFSTFGLESFNLLRDGEMKLALFNAAASTVLGVGLVFLGFIFSRYIARG